jgi:alpha-ribazole phosphatase/probable phosphoglycerate mutase
MSVKITYFAHGTTIDNEQEISSGWSDAPLSQLGIQQSIDLQKKIDVSDFDVVFCSDLQRSIQSAKLTFEDKVPIIQDARLKECNYGTYNGQSSEIVEPLQEKHITTNFPEGESYEDVKVRIGEFLEFLKKNYDGKHVAIVGHKAPQFAIEMLTK